MLKKDSKVVPLAVSRDGGGEPLTTSGNLEAKNVLQDKRGSLSKRPGLETVNNRDTSETTLEMVDGYSLFPYKDSVLAQGTFRISGVSDVRNGPTVARFEGDTSLAPALGRWERVQGDDSVVSRDAQPMEHRVVYSGNNYARATHCAYADGYLCVATGAQRTGGNQRVLLIIAPGGEIALRKDIPDADDIVQIVVSNGDFVAIYMNGETLKYWSLTIADLQGASNVTWTDSTPSLFGAINVNDVDACEYRDQTAHAIVALVDDTTPEVRLQVDGATTLGPINISTTHTIKPSVCYDHINDHLIVTALNGSGNVYIQRVDATTGSLVNSTTLSGVLNADTATPCIHMETWDAEGNSSAVHNEPQVAIWMNTTGGHVACYLYDEALTSQSRVVFAENFTLATKPFIHEYRSTCWLTHSLSEQPAHVLVTPSDTRVTPRVLSMLHYRTAAAWAESQVGTGYDICPPNVAVSDSYTFSPLTRLVESTGTGDQSEIIRTEHNTLRTPFVETSRGLFFGGPRLQQYESGLQQMHPWFHPETVTAVSASGGTGALEDGGSYSYKAVFVRMDAKGNIYRSAPSSAAVVTLTAGHTDATVTIQLGMLALDQIYNNTYHDCYFDLYRTTSGGSVYYKVTGQALTTVSGSINFSDSIADATIESNELLYTQSGELENTCPPAPRLLATYADRVLLVPAERPYEVWISKPPVDTLGLEFSELMPRLVIPATEEITQILELDGNGLIFTRRGVYSFGGDMPTATGAGAPRPPEREAMEYGTEHPRSVRLTNSGVLFYSDRGWCVMDRSFQSKYIGEPIEDLTTTNPVAVMDETESRLWVVDSAAPTPVWEEHAGGSWTTATSHTGVDAAIADGVRYILSSDGSMVRSTTGYTDPSSASIQMEVETPWFHLDDLAGFQRIYEIYVLGRYHAPHTVQVEIFYDGVDTVVETLDIAIASDPGAYLYRVQPSRQKCTSFKLRLKDTSPSGTEQSATWSALRLRYGRKAANHPTGDMA